MPTTCARACVPLRARAAVRLKQQVLARRQVTERSAAGVTALHRVRGRRQMGIVGVAPPGACDTGGATRLPACLACSTGNQSIGPALRSALLLTGIQPYGASLAQRLLQPRPSSGPSSPTEA